jgi:hypothetical protein
MRANGVPNFPDPAPGGGFVYPTNGTNPAAPANQTAMAKCQKLAGEGPVGGSDGPGPSAQTLAKMVKLARCVRQHGISEFPDPTTTNPGFGAGITQITNYDGVYLAFPSTLNLQSPAYKHALAACGAPPLGLPH